MCHLQLHDMFWMLAGPVKVRVVAVWQLFCGTVIITRSPPPGGSVSLDGLKVILGTPELEAFQLKLRVLELLLIEAIHIQALRCWSKLHCVLALKLGGLGETTIICGPAWTVSVT
jgi:hypothetical protein